MVSWWSLLRFLHVLSAAVWVGGQLTLSALLLPVLRRRLPEDLRASLTSSIGRRFGLYTLALFVPVQVGTGIGLAIEHGVTWHTLVQPGYGRTLTAKLAVFVVVMALSGLHGWAHGTGRTTHARALALGSLIGSCVIVLLATALVAS
jgi:putative copper export protein